MNRRLHILKDANPKEALSIISNPAPQGFSIILIQDAVGLTLDWPVKIYVLEEDARARGLISRFERIGYPEMLELIMASDSVAVW